MHAQPTVLDLETVNVVPLNLMEMSNLTLVASNAGGNQESLSPSVQDLLKAVHNTFTAILWKQSTSFCF